jgi:hypothetical protein
MLNRAFQILVALMVTAATAAAQESTPAIATGAGTAQTGSNSSDASSIVLAPKAKDDNSSQPFASDGVTRTVSAGVAAALSAGMPHYTPPTPTPTPAAEPVDMRDIDKPKNEIHRLPKFVVREARPPIFRNRDLFTMDGRLDLTMNTHAGLKFGNVLGLNSENKPGSPAYQMMVDDERQENMDDLKDTAHAISQGDPSGASYILQQSQATYMRGGGDWDWSASGPVGGILGGGGK